MKKQLHHIHDKSYRAFFENKEIFLELLQTFIKESWTELIDLSSLEEIKSHFILRDFEESESDIVYKAKIEGEEVYFIVLLELQSTVDHSMPIRLLFYMNEIWRKYIKNYTKQEIKSATFRLPTIIPIVLYNGADKWTVPLDFKEKLQKPQLFGDYVLNFKYHLINVNDYAKEDLLEIKNTIASIFLLDQQVNIEEFLNRVGALSAVYQMLSETHQLKIKDWLAQILKDDCREDVLTLLENNIEELSQMTPGFIQYRERELANADRQGFERGVEQGIEQEKLANAKAILDLADDKTIAKRLGLPIKIVRQLREETQQ